MAQIGSAIAPSSALSSAGPTFSARERVVDLLQLRFADDNLSLEEFERRVAVAYQAKTSEELNQLVVDLLPDTPVGEVSKSARISAILSSNERNGPMSLPRHLEIVAILGNVELDLTDSTFAAGVTEIAVSVVLGNVEITVPFGVRVECAGNALLGNFEYNAATIVGYPTDDARVVRITGHAAIGSVEISAAPSRTLRLSGDSPRRLA